MYKSKHKYTMTNLVDLVSKNFDISKEEAMKLIQTTRDEMLSAPIWEATEIFMENLGLEPDYIEEIF